MPFKKPSSKLVSGSCSKIVPPHSDGELALGDVAAGCTKMAQDRAITINRDKIGLPSLHEDGPRSRDYRK